MKYDKAQEQQLIVFLRYGATQPADLRYRWFTYAKIAQMINRSAMYVRNRCLKIVEAHKIKGAKSKVLTRQRLQDKIQSRWRRSQLMQEHLNYLVDPGTLKSWAGRTLQERRVLFHRMYPDIKISLYHLRLAYKEAGVKKKMIRIKKQVHERHRQRILEQTQDAKMGVEKAKADGYRVIYCDEMCTTKSTIPKTDWSARKTYPSTDVQAYHKKTIASIASVSHEKGLEMVRNYDKSVDQKKFVAFLKQLRQKEPFAKMAIFFDRLSVHRTKAVREAAEQLQIPLIFNASYSPNFNPIEGVIGLAKSYIKQQRWANIQQNLHEDDRKLINDGFKKIKLSTI